MKGREEGAEPRDVARAHVVIEGRVQGVCFRFETREEAECLGLAGWVRNLPDGTVEAVLEGPRDAVERMVTWCRQGPPLARVTRVDVAWEAPRGEGPGFHVAR
ncbi:MAG: acylphosphatase [Planctomycetes bacterium]|nr:acylphosphatase [Planctomycetota bacterium]